MLGNREAALDAHNRAYELRRDTLRTAPVVAESLEHLAHLADTPREKIRLYDDALTVRRDSGQAAHPLINVIEAEIAKARTADAGDRTQTAEAA